MINEQNPRLIGLTGFAGCGKSTVARYLVERCGYVPYKFASPLKHMLKTLGLTDEHLEGRLKEVPCDLLLGRTPRYAMQTLGTEWGRGCMGEQFWTNILVQRIQDRTAPVVVDDVRFFGEAEVIRSQGGILIRVERAGVVRTFTHESEGDIHVLPVDVILENNGDLPDLYTSIETALTELRRG